ncbi:MAG: HAMP domain-containing histidine kinase [Polyangiaceae bacterium]|nr:HAMP domain-containing histidine kinase [Polyangiaceae bacterium]
MKLGLRVRILLLLGLLLVLAFVPLFWAVATYTNIALFELGLSHAAALGRTAARHVLVERSRRSSSELLGLLSAETKTQGVLAIGVYDAQGRVLARSGEVASVDALERRHSSGAKLAVGQGPTRHWALAVRADDDQGSVVVAMRMAPRSARAAALVRIMGLYTAVMAAALLLAAYFALTRLIVRPLGELSAAAERVAHGARRLEVPSGGAAELDVLGTSLRTMTEKLMSEEASLRHKIDEVERATERLAQAQARLIRSERLASVGRLAAGLAHEIGNPISALIGLEDLLLGGGLSDEEQRDFLQRMRRETERIHRILRDLLQFARPAAGYAHSTDSEPGDVATAVDDTSALVLPQKGMHDIELVTEVEPNLPAVGLSREQLVQVLLNLVLNATDACGPGGRIRIAAQRFGPAEARGVSIAVEDNGPGVAPQIRERLFEPFVTTKEVGKGTGLGLAVCRGLVEAAGGTITLDSRVTSGARFVIELPRAESGAHPTP